MARNGHPLLRINQVDVFYGQAHVLRDLSLHVNRGEMVAIVGPNGSGKTTLLRTIQGLMHPADGAIWLEDQRIDRLPAYRLVEEGVALIPEARHLFLDMTVRQNLELGAYTRRARQEMSALLDRVYSLFPVLWEKRDEPACRLSAGQQQMLVIGRGLMAHPKLLLLDDPFLGLARGVTDRFCETLADINHGGVTVLIAGQNVRRLLRLSDRAYLVERGEVVLEGEGDALLEDPHLKEVLLTGRNGVGRET
ncbi:MAG: ABC transporter ATP-binding protein [Chloroflexi bacterium]|nr:MAG: ABC transporter ATP-binding protein [Chloroflexota bacterium]